MTRRVVVVGASGQIGRPLCAELIRAGHAARSFDRYLIFGSDGTVRESAEPVWD